MISNPFFFLSLLISAFFAFFTAAFIIEMGIRIFRLENNRVKATLRLFPFLNLGIDLVWNQYSLSYWMNPLSCASCVQKLLLEGFFPQVKSYLIEHQISFVTYLGFAHQHALFSTVFVLFGVISLFFFVRKLSLALFLMRSLHCIARRSPVYKSTIHSPLLRLMLQKHSVDIYLSVETQVPLTVYPNIIIIPQETTKILSKQELEAVIAHELEHVKYKDSLARLLCHLVAAFFWWIPTGSWIKKIEQGQEFACDRNVLKYGVSDHSITSALLKVARQVKTHQTLCCFTNSRNFTLVRIQDLLGLSTRYRSPINGLNLFSVCFGGLLLLICVLYL